MGRPGGIGIMLLVAALAAPGSAAAQLGMGDPPAAGATPSAGAVPTQDERVGTVAGWAESWGLRDPKSYSTGPLRRLLDGVSEKVSRVRLAPTTMKTPHGPVTFPGTAARFLDRFMSQGVAGLGGLNLRAGDPMAERTVEAALRRLRDVALPDGTEVDPGCRKIHEAALLPAVLEAMEAFPEGELPLPRALAAHRFYANGRAYLGAMEAFHDLPGYAGNRERLAAAEERFRAGAARLAREAAQGRVVEDGQVMLRNPDGFETLRLYAAPAPAAAAPGPGSTD